MTKKQLIKETIKTLLNLGAVEITEPKDFHNWTFRFEDKNYNCKIDAEGTILSIFGRFDTPREIGNPFSGKYNLHLDKKDPDLFEKIKIIKMKTAKIIWFFGKIV